MLLFYYSYRNLLVRRLTTLLTAGGMGLVIFVFATVLMLAEGFQQTLITSGSPENAVFIRRSAETEVQSIIERKDAAILESLPQVAMDKDWRKLAAREVVVLISLPKKESGSLVKCSGAGSNARTLSRIAAPGQDSRRARVQRRVL